MNIKILRILVFLMCISLQSVSAISAERKGSSTLILKQSNLELLDVTFHNMFEKNDFVSFKGKIKDTSQNILGNKSLNFAIDFDFQDAKSKTDNIVKFSRIDIKIEQLLDHEVTTKILKYRAQSLRSLVHAQLSDHSMMKTFCLINYQRNLSQ